MDLKNFTESLLDGDSIDDELFYVLANVARVLIEEDKDWRVLETDDVSQISSPGDTFLTMKDLPGDFSIPNGVFTVDSDNNKEDYQPYKFSERYAYKDSGRRFYIDYGSNKFALTGTKSKQATIHLIYKKTSAEITSVVAWEFPDRFHPILGFIIAEIYKGGVDYDQTNALQAVQHDKKAKALWNAMELWDNNLKFKEMGGQYGGQDDAYDLMPLSQM